MILKLDMPLIDPSLRAAQVVSWSKKVGEPIGFGDEICIAELNEIATLRRAARATLLEGRRRRKLTSDLEVRAGKISVGVAITSSNKAVLRKIIKDQGDQIAIGDTMAIVAPHDHSDLVKSTNGPKRPRCVVPNPADGDQDFEEGG